MPRIRPSAQPPSYNPVSGDTGSLFPPSGGTGPLPPSPGMPMPDFASLPQMAQGGQGVGQGPVDPMGMGGMGVIGGGGPPVQGPPVGGPIGGGGADPMRDALMQILGGKLGGQQPPMAGPPMPVR